MASGWKNGSITDFIAQTDADKKFAVKALTLYALGQFKIKTPVLTGQLKRSFTADFANQGLRGAAQSNMPYAERIWVEGWSQKLPPAAVDGIIAGMLKLPIRLENA